MAFFFHGMGFLMLLVVQCATNTGLSADALSLMQERMSYKIDLGHVNPYDKNGIDDMNALGELVLGIPYEKMIRQDLLAKRTQTINGTAIMSLSNRSTMHSAKTIMKKSMEHMHDAYQQYKEAVVIINVFTHFDTNRDNKIDRKEMDAILAYLGEHWDDEKTNKLMHDLDHMNVDGLIQPTEFFFWFTWPTISNAMNFEEKIENIKNETHRLEREAQFTEEIESDTVDLESNNIPEDPADVKKVFGKFTQFPDTLRIILFFKTFDSNWDGKVNREEFTAMLGFLEPGFWSPQEIDSLVAALDLLEKDQEIALNEWFFWFTPTFANVWEPAIHAAAKTQRA